MIPDDLAPTLQRETSTYAETLTLLGRFEISTPEDLDTVGGWLRHAKSAWKDLEARRTKITQPLLLAKKGVDDLFREPLTTLGKIEALLKFKVAAYTAKVEAERQATMIVSAAEHSAGGMPTHVIEAPAKTEGVSTREVLDFEITDPALVPRRYCSPDVGLIREVLRAAGDLVDIPGIRVFRKTQVTVR